MGTIAEKGAYTIETKSLLKQAINNIGGEVTDETTFRQYVNQLENAYDRLPKTEFEEGESVTLENTLKGKLDYENGVVGIGQTEQDSTTGKNLFNLTDYNSDKWSVNYASNVVKTKDSITFDCSGGVEGVYFNATNIASLIDNYDANKTYYISLDIEVDANSRFYWGSSNVRATNITAGKQRISISDKISSALVFYNLDSSHNTISKIMICETNDTTFEQYTGGQASPNPSYEQTINSVTGNQDVVVSGINEINVEYPTTTAYGVTCTNNGNGTYTFNGTAERDLYFDMAYFTLPAGTQKLVGCPSGGSWNSYIQYIRRVDGQAFSINDMGSGGSTEVTGNEGQLRLSILIKSGYTCNNLLFKPMVTDNTSLTYSDFEPYITPTSYQLSLGDKELFEDSFIDRDSNGNWYFNDSFVRIVCTSDMTWYKSSTTAVDKYYTRTPYDFDSSVTGESIGNKCTHFSFKNNASVVGQWDYNQNNDKLALFFCFATYNTSNINSFKTWLDSANMSCVVKVPTPIETPITDTTLISQLNEWYNAQSNNGTTIITSNGDLPMIIKCRALKGES